MDTLNSTQRLFGVCEPSLRTLTNRIREWRLGGINRVRHKPHFSTCPGSVINTLCINEGSMRRQKPQRNLKGKFFLNFVYLFVYLFWAVLGLHC